MGLEGSRWLVDAWTREDGMRALHLDDAERDGRYGRITPAGLLRFPAWMPFLHGFEPYGDLVDAVRSRTVHPAAVREFAYDWRLPVEHNGRLLADEAHRHLTAWRQHAAHQAARDVHGDGRAARLVFVCHSMGGLLARAAFAHAAACGSGLDGETRAVITLGTPFHGAAKAAVILNGNRSDPLPAMPRHGMRRLAATLPGVHDLLPGYRCLDTGTDAEHLTPADVEAIGGDRELAASALDFQRRMRTVSLPGHRIVHGVAQPTACASKAASSTSGTKPSNTTVTVNSPATPAPASPSPATGRETARSTETRPLCPAASRWRCRYNTGRWPRTPRRWRTCAPS